jgi:type IV secretory pathway VirB6-like protein
MTKKSFNDRLVSRTVIPAIYLWLSACAAVVYTGITKPDVVLTNLDGFIALIAIIGGVAAPAFNTLLRTWEAEQANEVADMPAQFEHDRVEDTSQHAHMMFLEKQDNEHRVDMERNPHVEEYDLETTE